MRVGMVEATPGAPEGGPGWVSWREAVTPISRASRRRWVIGFVGVLLAGAFMALFPDAAGLNPDGMAPPFTVGLLLAVIFGMLRRGTNQLTAFDHPTHDERDRAATHAAYRIAYPLLLGVALLSAAGLLALPDVVRDLGADAVPHLALDFEALIGLAIWGFAWATFLPTAVLAWREPDAPFDPDEIAGPRESTRDALLGVAVVGALALSGPGHSGGWGMLALGLALTVIASLARRSVGQQPLSTQVEGVGTFLVVVGLFGIFAGSFADGWTAFGWLSSLGSLLVGSLLLVLARPKRIRAG